MGPCERSTRPARALGPSLVAGHAVLGGWTATERAWRIEVRAVGNADAVAVDQLSAEPARDQRKAQTHRGKNDRRDRWIRRIRLAEKPARGKETGHDDVPNAVQETDLLGAR